MVPRRRLLDLVKRCIRTTLPLTTISSPALPLSNLWKTIIAHRRAAFLLAARAMTIRALARFGKQQHRLHSPKTRIHSSPATKATMRMFHHEYAGSVCRITGQSRPPTESVVFPVRRAVHRNHPNRTDIRVPRHSIPIYLLALQRQILTVVDIVEG